MNDAPRQNIWFTSAAQSSGPSAVPDCSSLCSLEPSWGENIFSFTSNVRNFRKRHHKDKKIRTPVSKVSAALGLFLGSHTCMNILHISESPKPLGDCCEKATHNSQSTFHTNLAWSVSSAKVFMASTTRGSPVKRQREAHQTSQRVSSFIREQKDVNAVCTWAIMLFWKGHVCLQKTEMCYSSYLQLFCPVRNVAIKMTLKA